MRLPAFVGLAVLCAVSPFARAEYEGTELRIPMDAAVESCERASWATGRLRAAGDADVPPR